MFHSLIERELSAVDWLGVADWLEEHGENAAFIRGFVRKYFK